MFGFVVYLVEEDVGWFEVVVCDVFGVGEGEVVEYLLEECEGVFWVDCVVVYEVVEEVFFE